MTRAASCTECILISSSELSQLGNQHVVGSYANIKRQDLRQELFHWVQNFGDSTAANKHGQPQELSYLSNRQSPLCALQCNYSRLQITASVLWKQGGEVTCMVPAASLALSYRGNCSTWLGCCSSSCKGMRTPPATPAGLKPAQEQPK